MTKLIIINGPLGSGKTTLAREYAELNPMTLVLDIDRVWFMISGWRANWKESSGLANEMAMGMARTYLKSGHDVIVPQIIHKQKIFDDLQTVSNATDARLIEVFLDIEIEKALERYVGRLNGGAPPEGYIPDRDSDIDKKKARFRKMYTDMVELHKQRNNSINFTPTINDVGNDAKKITELIQEYS